MSISKLIYFSIFLSILISLQSCGCQNKACIDPNVDILLRITDAGNNIIANEIFLKDEINIISLSTRETKEFNIDNDSNIIFNALSQSYAIEIQGIPRDTFNIGIESFRTNGNYFACCAYNDFELFEFIQDDVNLCVNLCPSIFEIDLED